MQNHMNTMASGFPMIAPIQQQSNCGKNECLKAELTTKLNAEQMKKANELTEHERLQYAVRLGDYSAPAHWVADFTFYLDIECGGRAIAAQKLGGPSRNQLQPTPDQIEMLRGCASNSPTYSQEAAKSLKGSLHIVHKDRFGFELPLFTDEFTTLEELGTYGFDTRIDVIFVHRGQCTMLFMGVS